jgi:hypothetical protein
MPEQAKLAITKNPTPDVLNSALPKAGTWIGVNQIRIDGKAEDRTDEGLHPVSVRCRSGGNHAFAQGDYIAALDFVEAPVSLLWENMKPQVALVCSRRSLKPAGVFVEIAVGKRGETPGVRLFALSVLFLDWVGPARDFTTEVRGSGPCLGQ